MPSWSACCSEIVRSATVLSSAARSFSSSRSRACVVVSASRSLLETPRNEIIDLAVRELGEFFPAVKEARLERAQVIKEVRATFSAKPGLEALRPTRRAPDVGGLDRAVVVERAATAQTK